MAEGLDKLVTLQYNDFMDLGKRIKRARKEHGLSQARLAKMIRCSEFSVVNWETKGTKPLPMYMEKLVEILGRRILEDPDEKSD